MKEKLKLFFQNNIHKNTENKDDTYQYSLLDKENNKASITYKDWGYLKATNQNGHLLAFRGCLNLVKKQFLHEQDKDSIRRQELILNAQTEIDKLNIDVEHKNNQINNYKDSIVKCYDKIKNLEKQICDIEENPNSITKDNVSKAGFWIGLFIIAFLTIYLFIFYSSASYSGFFKDFTEDLGTSLGNSIFDPKAIIKAWNNGVTEVILILTIPFVFLGLGYLIYRFEQEEKGFNKVLKIGSMILMTLGFDSLLAYKIEKGLYEVERLNDPTGSMPAHELKMAFTSENFWLVIFAGFIVYIIWGFIFDFVMASYDKLDVIKQAVNSREKQIDALNKEINEYDDKIQKEETDISQIKQFISEQDKIIKGDTSIIDWSGFERELHNFTEGWTHWMTENGLTSKFKDEIWESLNAFSQEHKQEMKNKENNNNKTYQDEK